MLQMATPSKRLFYQNDLKEPVSYGDQNDIESAWQIPIQLTVAIDGKGVTGLVDLISKHRTYLEQTGDFQVRERTRLARELNLRLQASLLSEWRENLPDGLYEEVLDHLVSRDISPQDAVVQLRTRKVKK
jgi:LAO/AO transport system kinase